VKLTIDTNLKESLAPELTRLNQSLERLARSSDGYLGDLLTYVLLGSGKRVRPALVFLGARLGSSIPHDVQVVAQAVELVHIATLVHDDVIDQAALRRARKTVYNEHGVDAAVRLGDHIYTYAFQKVAELGNPLLIQLLAHSTAVMCAGEIDQLKNRYQFNVSEQEYFSFISQKTASLFGTSARSGAILSGQDIEVQIALEQFGVDLGIAFQIKDDLLDLIGEEDVVGKTLRTDLLNGKMTLPLIHFRDHVFSTLEKETFFENLQHPNGHLTDLIDRLKQSASMEYAENVAHEHVERALSRLDALPKGSARDLFASLAEMLLLRKA
jgi:heptaprenyl diphosphate synthase